MRDYRVLALRFGRAQLFLVRLLLASASVRQECTRRASSIFLTLG